MSNKSRPLRYFLLSALLLLNALLDAQTVEYAEFGPTQRLAWTADQYALRYEVLVEKEDGNEYRRAAREFTGNSFIQLSLPQGKYRYQVIPYDFLNRPAKGSEWKKIEVRAALVPELYYTVPEIFYIGEDETHTLYISGKNMESDAGFSLQGPGLTPIIPYTKQILADGSQAWLSINDSQLIPGVYTLHVRNPSGLEARSKALTVAHPEPEPEPAETEGPAAAPAEYRKPVEIGVGAAWMPMLPIYGKNGLFFSNRPSLIGAIFHLDLIYPKPDFLDLGLELATSWYIFYPDHNENEDASLYHIAFANAATVTFNFLAQKCFFNRTMSLRFRLGTGLTIPPDNGKPPLAADLYYPLLTMESFHINLGASFLWYIQKQLYLEFGMDYTHQLSKLPSGCLRPWFGIGWRF
jgi:hypothetical protein